MSEEVSQATHDVAYWQQRATQAEQRERIAVEAYNGQQQSYRELEALYQASQERAIRAEEETVRLGKVIRSQREELDHVYHALNDPYPLLHRELEAARAVVKTLEANRIRGHCALCGGLDVHTATCAIGQYYASLEAHL